MLAGLLKSGSRWATLVVLAALSLELASGASADAQSSPPAASEGTEESSPTVDELVPETSSDGARLIPYEPQPSPGSVFEGTGDEVIHADRLSGELFTPLEEQGIEFELFGTQFYQGIARGGEEKDWTYGGKLDYLMRIDGAKIGLWEGFSADLHGETRLGQAVNDADGLITPSNIAMFFPEPEGNLTALTGIKLNQQLTDDFAVFAGKINTLDEYPLRFDPRMGLGRPGIGGFMNTSFVFNPIAGRTIPYSAAGVGAAWLSEGEPLFSLAVFDPIERATVGFEGMYEEGVVFMPDLILRPHLFGLPGVYNFGGTYSTAEYQSVDPASYLVIPDIGVIAGTEQGSWSLYANFYQALWADPNDEHRSWGLFGQFGISDGNPNPIGFVANGGLAGRSMISGREMDTFGAGFFYVGLSNSFKTLAEPVLPQQDEYGVEFFYNIKLTNWCLLSPDLQIARPSTQEYDPVIIPGLRMEVIF